MLTDASRSTGRPGRPGNLRRHAIAASLCAGTALLATPLLDHLDLANIVMLFLLTVLAIAVKLGRGPAILASVLSVLLFDVFFVPPRFSLAVSNVQYLVTFAVMLLTALVTTHLTAGLDERAREARISEARSRALYRLARQLAGALTTEQVNEQVAVFVRDQLGATARVLTVDEVRHPPAGPWQCGSLRVDPHLARTALEGGKPVHSDDAVTLGYAPLYLPLTGSTSVRGVLCVNFAGAEVGERASGMSLLEALASLIAVAVERVHYSEVARDAEIGMAAERLRSSILSAVSHDVRTPLTALVGLADSLFLVKPALPTQALETAQALHEQAARLAGSVEKLLEMGRLQAGEVKLRREWQPLEEVVGSSIKLLGSALAAHPLTIVLAPNLPLLEFDAVLIERVLCNLLENAAKYAPAGTPIELSASAEGDAVEVSVTDRGPGFPEGAAQALFEMFARGEAVAGKPGVGLGLAICRAIVEAHGGTMRAVNPGEGGARVSFTLPVGVPPVVEDERT